MVGAYWALCSAVGWAIRTDSRVDELDREVRRLTERIDAADKERWPRGRPSRSFELAVISALVEQP